MRISGFTTIRPNGPDTRTYEDFMKFLGEKPARLGIVSNLYSQYTATHLTEALMNVWAYDKKGKSFQSLDSFMVEWDIKVNRIHRVQILRSQGNGFNKADILFYMPENYYQKFDVFMVEETRQQFRVINRPQRIRDNEWLVVAQIHDGDYASEVAGGVGADADLAGLQTRFITNYMPEMHEEGYTRYQSNTEKHRAYIATHRADIDMSSKYNAAEQVFIGIAKDNDKNEHVYQMNTAEKACIDSFMEARNNALLWGKTNLDIHGKPTAFDPETGRPIIAGDGIIAQIERFATKFVFAKLTVAWFKKALMAMVNKCDNASGNSFVFICNTLMYADIQGVLDAWLKDYKVDATFLWSKGQNGKIKLGAEYESYSFMGNTITFKLDRSIDIEYPDRKFGCMLDLTADAASGKAALNMLTFKGGEFIHNWMNGVGGRTGLASGEVSSPVAASKIMIHGLN